jgi:hypothetical protein
MDPQTSRVPNYASSEDAFLTMTILTAFYLNRYYFSSIKVIIY